MDVLSAKEIEEKFGITEEELDALEKDASQGILHGEPRGDVQEQEPANYRDFMQAYQDVIEGNVVSADEADASIRREKGWVKIY